ncbi:MAG: hypothetical protein ACPG5P_00485 [Saprospiraceae bacterium]
MPKLGRQALKDRFDNESMRTVAFRTLVDSTFNINDDKIGISNDYGLTISPTGGSQKLLSFYEKFGANSPAWSLSLQSKSRGNKGLNFMERDESRLFIQNGGRVGIGTESPRYQMDVNGMVAATGFVGTHATGTIDADAKWHTVSSMKDLKGCQAFEIYAHINDDKDSRFGLTCALLLISSGKRRTRNKIHTVESSSGWLWGRFLNRIKFRWIQNEMDGRQHESTFSLQIRSRSHYGMDGGRPKKIFFRVTKKWDMDYEKETYPVETVAPKVRQDFMNPQKPRSRGKISIKKK